MSPSLEFYDKVSEDLPIKPVVTKINGTTGVAAVTLDQSEKHDLVLNYFRAYIADLCQQFNGGHPGSAMGMAAIGIALYKYIMKFSPKNGNYFNRDRFVLSNGHACLWQYLFMHLVGVESMTTDQLKSYHSSRYDSICPGHPEIENEGVEVTTGPLGQGVANAVGLAMATKNLAATYNRDGHEVVNNMTWCMIGDACLQEGVGLEAVSLAGHWKLNNLCIIYDNNNITCDGTADVANSGEDINEKMKATGWEVIDILDGHSNVSSIVHALLQARSSSKPTFINIRTVIGFGSDKAGTAATHGAALGLDDVVNIKKTFGLNPEEHFVLPQQVYDFFSDVATRGKQLEEEWATTVSAYEKAHPELAAEFKLRVEGKMPADWTKFIPKKEELPLELTATRKSAGIVGNPLGENMGNFLVGTADLTPSCNVAYKKKVDFQSPELKTACGLDGNYSGRYIHYGIREHAMCAISNGLAAFNKGTFLPITSSCKSLCSKTNHVFVANHLQSSCFISTPRLQSAWAPYKACSRSILPRTTASARVKMGLPINPLHLQHCTAPCPIFSTCVPAILKKSQALLKSRSKPQRRLASSHYPAKPYRNGSNLPVKASQRAHTYSKKQTIST